jgi:hypothetical protein
MPELLARGALFSRGSHQASACTGFAR